MESLCSVLSERAGEQLGATATAAEHWLLIEVPGSWERDVSQGAGLSDSVRQAVGVWLGQLPSSRVLYIRRPGRSGGGGRLVFVVSATERNAESRRIELASLDDLADLDLTRAGVASASPLVLVCGHGTRDRCCALRGTAVFGSLEPRLGPEQLWLSSHQGGHRFAANVLVLPLGVQFGRVTAAEAPLIVDRVLAGEITLGRYRGRTAYNQDVQAAERAVREAAGLTGLTDLSFDGVEGDLVLFRGRDGRRYAAGVETTLGPDVPASCGADPAPQEAFTARVR
jgi:hypothetical protein